MRLLCIFRSRQALIAIPIPARLAARIRRAPPMLPRRPLIRSRFDPGSMRKEQKGEVMKPSKRILISLAIGIPSLGALVVALAAGLLAHGAFAAAKTVYVGGCGAPNYSSVQAAVNAAGNGYTVYVCSGTYSEQVIIANKALTLTGAPGATIQAPSVFPSSPSLPAQFASDGLFVPQAIVVVWGSSSNVTISSLTVQGVLPGNGGCAEQEFGVLVIDGATATISNDRVLDARDSNPALYGCQFGVGIQVGRRYWPTANFGDFLVENFVGHATITGATVSGYQKNGITIDGPGSTADVRDTTVQGGGRVPYIAQNGIQISRGATGSVRTSAITGDAYTGPNLASSVGILVYGGCGDPLDIGVQFVNNTLTNNDVGVSFNNYSDDCSGPASVETLGKVTNNSITNDAVTNFCPYGYVGCAGYVTYQVGIDDVGNGDKLDGNKISGSGYVNPANDPPNGIYILPIDSGISFPNANAKIHGNQVR
jgi:hypothetical protein